MPESMRTRLMRWGFNFFPAYRGTGARVLYIADDWREVRIKVPLSWRTRNYVGSIFGGSMYGAIDPIYMLILIKILGPDYVVWDKTASIRFRRPGRGTLFASFRVSDDDVTEIRNGVAAAGKYEKEYVVELRDSAGEVHAICQKVIHISRRR
jgi:acyl-coenzyme A thioesterase PaaI-like protein